MIKQRELTTTQAPTKLTMFGCLHRRRNSTSCMMLAPTRVFPSLSSLTATGRMLPRCALAFTTCGQPKGRPSVLCADQVPQSCGPGSRATVLCADQNASEPQAREHSVSTLRRPNASELWASSTAALVRVCPICLILYLLFDNYK